MIGAIAMRLLVRVLLPQLELPDWSLLEMVEALFLWGFSQRIKELDEATPDAAGSGQFPVPEPPH